MCKLPLKIYSTIKVILKFDINLGLKIILHFRRFFNILKTIVIILKSNYEIRQNNVYFRTAFVNYLNNRVTILLIK